MDVVRVRTKRSAARQTAWRMHGVSVTGYRHLKTGVECQDAWQHQSFGPPERRVTVLAVADGAGSRPHSATGAQVAVELATQVLGEYATGALTAKDERGQSGLAVHHMLKRAFADVRTEFLARVRAEGGKNGKGGPASAEDYATTLTAVVLTAKWIGHLSVGDGFVVLRSGAEGEQRQYHLLPQPEAVSEYSNETVFLSSGDAEQWLRTECVRDPEVDGALLSTDGLAQAALAGHGGRVAGANPSFVGSVLRKLDQPGPDPQADEDALSGLLNSDRLTALNADDKTLLRAVRP